MSKPARWIPTAIAEASASGLPPEELEHSGKTYRIRLAEAPLPSVYLRSKGKAQGILEAARVIYDAAMKRPPRIEKDGILAIPGRKKRERVRFELWEADELITSHDPHTWRPRDDYPGAVQERDYLGSTDEKQKVEEIAKDPDPLFLLARAPTAIDGAPVILFDGAVMGGNGRTMGLQLAYERGTAGRYRDTLRERAPEFGISQEAVDQAKKPVLVRAIKVSEKALKRELASLSSALNASMSGSKDDIAQSVAIARQLSPATIASIGALLEDASLREAMDAKPSVFVEALRADGILTDRNREEWMSGASLSKAAKLRLEQAFLARAVETVERLRAMSPSLAQKVERLIPAMTRVDARDNGHSLTKHLQAAVDLLNDAAARGIKLEDLLAQQELFGSERPTSQAQTLARVLERSSRVQLGKLADKWAALADFDPQQRTMFGKNSTPQEAFKVWQEASK